MTKISSVFKPLYQSKKRYFLLTGGRGSLKSSSVHDFIARLTYQRGHGILFTRYTMSSAELSIIPEFRIVLQRLGNEDDFHITKQIVTNKRTGSFIYFSGIKTASADHTGKLKSIAGITTWIIEEGEDFNDQKVFNTIDDSIRTTEHQNRVIWIQNPTTKEHFIYKWLIEKQSKQIDVHGFNVTVSANELVEHIHTTYHIAEGLGYLAKDWIAKAELAKSAVLEKINQVKISWTKSPEALKFEINKIWHSSFYYYNYIGGWLERAEGTIFENWIEGKFDNSLSYDYGLDYGYVHPLALTKVAVDHRKKKIYIKQVIYESFLDDVIGRLKFHEIKRNDLIVCDTNEPRTTERIRQAGFNIQEAHKQLVAEDIREIKGYLIVVDPDSNDLKKELNNYVWNDKKAEIPVKLFDDGLDAMRYGFNRLVIPFKAGVRRRN